MFKINAETYADTKFHTVIVSIEDNVWVRIRNVHNELGIKNISDLIGKGIHGIFDTKNPTKGRIRKCKRP